MENPSLPNDFVPPGFNLQKPRNNLKVFVGLVVSLFTLIIVGCILFFSAPKNFPKDSIINIEEGANLRQISKKFKTEHIIRSRMAFEAFVIFYEGEKHILPGDYLFKEKVPVYEVAKRISEGNYGLAPVKVTIPEGFTVDQIAEAFSFKLSNFNKEKFLQEARDKEGYLFPDTYFFLTTDSEQRVLSNMSKNYEKKIKPLLEDFVSFGKSEQDIIIMASIVEKEAKGDADRAVIAGILWKRLSIGMPLQVDAALVTYKEKGLPDNPISNPGLESIEATIHPENSNFLYYLHDKDGTIHYARNFEEHKANKFKYLK